MCIYVHILVYGFYKDLRIMMAGARVQVRKPGRVILSFWQMMRKL